jgi:ATPase family associated with various cellular activities (AAA)
LNPTAHGRNRSTRASLAQTHQAGSIRISSAQGAAQLSLQADETARELTAPMSAPVVDACAQPEAQTYRIDLSQVASKYIGETEKNLSLMFDRAQRFDAVLLFDEADALLGKRSEVKDSRDRYANLEVNYLLQRLESHEGIAMLASQWRQGPVDPDALKHLKAQVQIPTPPGPPRSQG